METLCRIFMDLTPVSAHRRGEQVIDVDSSEFICSCRQSQHQETADIPAHVRTVLVK